MNNLQNDNITDLRGISPLRELHTVYVTKNKLIKSLTVKLETNSDGSLHIYIFEDGENYIVSLFSGENRMSFLPVPVATEPRVIEMLMGEMLSKAEANVKEAYQNAIKSRFNWNDADLLDCIELTVQQIDSLRSRMEPANRFGDILEHYDNEIINSVMIPDKLLKDNPQVFTAIAARDIKQGDFVVFNPAENTGDFLINGSVPFSGEIFTEE